MDDDDDEQEEKKRRLDSLPLLTGSSRRLMPLVGETPLFVRDHLKFALERARKHGPVFKTSLYGMRDVAFVTDFPSIEKVMYGEHAFTEHFQPASFSRLLGTAAAADVMKDKVRHGKQRRQQARAFSPAALASYAPRVAEATERAVASWAQRCKNSDVDAAAAADDDASTSSSSSSPSSSSSSRPSVDLGSVLSDLTWEYALATVVDLALSGEEKVAVRSAWDDFSRNLFSAPLDVPGSRFRTALRARETLAGALRRSVREYRESFGREEGKDNGGENVGNSKPPTMLSYYMRARADDGDPISEDELVDTAIGLLLAGYETSHSAHFLLLYVLASPQLPGRVREALEREQRDVVAKHGDAEGGLTSAAAALNDMPVADACSKWCLWALGPADGIFRRALADFELHGKRIEKGTVIYNSFLAAKALDEKIVGPGGVFDVDLDNLPPAHVDVNNLASSFAPERFLQNFTGSSAAVSMLLDHSSSSSSSSSSTAAAAAAAAAAAEPTSVATFGFGNHFCLGAPLYALEAKALVATIVRNYDLSFAPTENDEPPMKFATSWAATSRSGPDVRVVVREKKSKQ